MKKIIRLVALLMLVVLVGCNITEATSSIEEQNSETTSEAVSSEENTAQVSSEESSKETSSKEQKKLSDFIMADGFLDVQAASLEIKRKGGNDSIYFEDIEGIKGYEINGGIYWVDEETIRRLANTPCRGDGGIKWLGFKDCGSWSTCKEQPETAPANLINDPLYMSMILPSERRCFLADRINASFLDVADDKWINVMTIGAVYKNKDIEVPDDAEFTLCISDINLALRTTKSDGWYEAINVKVPKMTEQLYYLPWPLEHTLGTYKFPEGENRVTYYDDHVEIKLYGYDLNATEAKKVSDEVSQCVYHFWGQKHYFRCKGSEVLGLASSFKIWVKEPEAAEYLTVGIGADWRDSNEKPLQAFAGYKHAVTNEPTVVAGHTVPLSKWDEVVGDESEKIQEIIGLK